MTKNALITGWGMYAPSRVMTNDDLATHGRHLRRVDRHPHRDPRATDRGRRRDHHDPLGPCRAGRAGGRRRRPGRARPRDRRHLLPGLPAARHRACSSPPSWARIARRASTSRQPAPGFVYGLATGTSFIRSGMYRNVLVIGVEVLSRFIDWRDRSTCVLFGDGAGAVLLQASDQPGGLLGDGPVQ